MNEPTCYRASQLIRLASHVSWLTMAIIQFGCALPAGGESTVSVLSAPFAGVVGGTQTSAEVCLTAARKLERKGQIKPATAKYEEARRLDPSAPVAHALALLYNREGDIERARAEFALALQAGPRDAELLTDMGCFAFEHGNYAEAEKLLRQALAAKPNSERACVVLGLVLGKQSRYEESFDAFAKILSRDEIQAAEETPASNEESTADKSVKSSKKTLARLQQEASKLNKADAPAHTP